MGRYKAILVIVLTTCICCTDNPEQYIGHIEGYWQIQRVEQNNKLLREYTSNTIIDYFKMNNDGSGFRKKVTPNLEGSFNVSGHSANFKYRIERDSLNIYYDEDPVNFKETIKRATANELIITNARGFRYIYLPYSLSKAQE